MWIFAITIRRSLLPIVLVTTVTLSSSNVLPILSLNKIVTEPLLEDQDSDNTFNDKHTNVNPNNIFYKVFIETPRTNILKKSQLIRSKYTDNDSQDPNILEKKIDKDDDDDGFRKEQWHNYPRQLDRLNRNINSREEFEKILLDTKDLENQKGIEEANDNFNQYITNDVGSYNIDNIDGPLLILKIRLASNPNLNNYIDSDLVPLESDIHTNINGKEENVSNENDIESLVKVKRKGKSRKQEFAFLENSNNDKKTVKKRIFSLWSRLQSLSHRGHELHHRRHLYALYGSPEDSGGALTAETRGTMIRPPGSPLRWG